jgi:hypothetical protein
MAVQDEHLLALLEGLAEQLGIPVRYASLSTEEYGAEGGACVIRGDRRIIIEQSLSGRQKARLLAEALGDTDLESFFLLPAVREAIERARKIDSPPVRVPLEHQYPSGTA